METTYYKQPDYEVLCDSLFPFLEKNQIAVGVFNMTLIGQPCLMEYEFQGKKYKRLHTEAIPHRLAGDVCSVQIYELIEDEKDISNTPK